MLHPNLKRAQRLIEKIKRECDGEVKKPKIYKPKGRVYYVYGLFDPRDNKAFYVGKGYKDRASQHLKDCRNGVVTNPFKHRKIMEILNSWLVPQVVYLCSGLDEMSAYRVERSVIRHIGLKNLTNTLPGVSHENERLIEELKDDFKRIRPYCRWREKVLWQLLPGSGMTEAAHEATYWDWVGEMGHLRAHLSNSWWPDLPPIYDYKTRELRFYDRGKNVSAEG